MYNFPFVCPQRASRIDWLETPCRLAVALKWSTWGSMGPFALSLTTTRLHAWHAGHWAMVMDLLSREPGLLLEGVYGDNHLFLLLIARSFYTVCLRDGSIQTILLCHHDEIEVAVQTICSTQSQYTDTGPPSPGADLMTPAVWQCNRWSAKFNYCRAPKYPRLWCLPSNSGSFDAACLKFYDFVDEEAFWHLLQKKCQLLFIFILLKLHKFLWTLNVQGRFSMHQHSGSYRPTTYSESSFVYITPWVHTDPRFTAKVCSFIKRQWIPTDPRLTGHRVLGNGRLHGYCDLAVVWIAASGARGEP